MRTTAEHYTLLCVYTGTGNTTLAAVEAVFLMTVPLETA